MCLFWTQRKIFWRMRETEQYFSPTIEVNGAPKQPDYKLSSEYLPLCSEQTHSYRFGSTWGWVNDDRTFIFGCTVPLMPFQFVSAAYTHFPNFAFFFKRHTQIQELHKMQKASHLLQNEALRSKYHKHISKANTFAIISIPVCYKENCVVFCKKVFMKLKTKSKADNYCLVLQIWCVFEWQLSETVWQGNILCVNSLQ